MGAIFARRHEDEKAIEYFKKSIEAEPGAFEGYANLGTLYLYNRNFESALENHALAIQNDPDGLKRNSGKSFYETGVAHFLLGNLEKVRETAETLREIGRTNLAEKLERILKGEDDPLSPVETPPPAGVQVLSVQ